MIQRTLEALALAVAAAGVLLLAGCGASPPAPAKSSPLVAAKLLSTANTNAFGTSFEAAFQGGIKVTLTGVGGLPGSGMQQLTKLQQELNANPLSGTIDFQSPTEFRISYSLPGLLPQPLQLIEVGGGGYASLDGTHWYALSPAPAGSSGLVPGLPLPSSMTNLPSELKSLGTTAQGATTVTNLGATTRDGVPVDHLQVVVSGAGLDRILSGSLGALGGGSTPSLGSQTAGLSQLLRFNPTTADIYIGTKTHLPQRESVSTGTTVNLGALGLLVPKQSPAPSQSPAPQGSIGLSLDFAVNYSHYGASFAIHKPTDILPGQLPLPGSLSPAP